MICRRLVGYDKFGPAANLSRGAGDSSVYVAGATESIDFPVVSPLQPARAGGFDALVARLNAAGTGLVFSTYLGGAGDDVAQAIALDSDGIVYVTGAADSAAFPTATPIQSAGGLLDAFVTQIVEAGIIQFTLSSYQVNENAGTATISVQRTGDTSAPATVQFATSNGIDMGAEAIKTFSVVISNPAGGASLGARTTAEVRITDPR